MLDQRPDHHDAIVALAELLADRRDDGRRRRGAGAARAHPRDARDPPAWPPWSAPASPADAGDDAACAEITAKLDALLDQVKGDDEARQEFVDLLEVLGPDDPRTADYRKRLTRRLF